MKKLKMKHNIHTKFVFVDTANFLVSARSMAVAQGEYNADPVAFGLLSKICRAGYSLVLSNVCKNAQVSLIEALSRFKIHATLRDHDPKDRAAVINEFLATKSTRARPLILDSQDCPSVEFADCWHWCSADGVSHTQMIGILSRLKDETSANKPIPKALRSSIKEDIAGSGLNFTYLRRFKDGKVQNFGGAVIAWQLDSEKFDHTSIRYAIVRCHVRDQFDKTIGRELASQRYFSADVSYAPYPEDGRVSQLFKKEFIV